MKSEIEKMRRWPVVVTTKVVEVIRSIIMEMRIKNLFTLCDQVSGFGRGFSGVDGVTLQSSINYLKAGRLGDVLTIHGECDTVDGRLELWMLIPIKMGPMSAGSLHDVVTG